MISIRTAVPYGGATSTATISATSLAAMATGHR